MGGVLAPKSSYQILFISFHELFYHIKRRSKYNKMLNHRDDDRQTVISSLNVQKKSQKINEDAESQAQFLKEYFIDFPRRAEDVYSSFDRKYRTSGVSSLAEFLECVCCLDGFLPVVQMRAVEALLSFFEKEEIISEEDPWRDLKVRSNLELNLRNKIRKERGIRCLVKVLRKSVNKWGRKALPTLLKFNGLLRLWDLSSYQGSEVMRLLKVILEEPSLEGDYVLKLVKSIGSKRRKIYRRCLVFYLGNVGLRTTWRIMAGQMLLSDIEEGGESGESKDVVLAQIEIFAEDAELDIHVRAEAADIMLGFGNADVQRSARDIINRLGIRGFGVYENAQNVHSSGIEDSVESGLLRLKNRTMTTLSTVEQGTMWQCTVDKIRGRYGRDEIEEKRWKIIDKALTKIELTTRVFSGMTACDICFGVVRTIDRQSPPVRETLWKRFFDEMVDLVRTCSSGIVSRLLNTLSGFAGYELNISWDDQIRSNFVGRFNAVARSLIDNDEHPFFAQYKEVLVSIFLSGEKEEEKEEDEGALLLAMASREDEVKIRSVGRCPKSWAERIIEDPRVVERSAVYFKERLFIEFSASEGNRKCFNLFLRHTYPRVREELWEEFKEHVCEDVFDVCMRDALSFYEGV
jgi:hypothetical protein